MLQKTMSGEPVSLKIVNKINGKLKFLYRKNRFLRPELRRMLCNALIQPHFDYACPAWYPNLNQKNEKKKKRYKLCKINKILPTTGQMHHISEEDFRFINWLPTSKRVDQCINTCPYYLKEIFEFTPHCRIDTRNTFIKLKTPFCKTNMDQKAFHLLVLPCGTFYLN